jgi:hypothetical protein
MEMAFLCTCVPPVNHIQVRVPAPFDDPPRTWASRYGLSVATTDNPIRVSRLFLALSVPSPVQTKIESPSRSTHTGSTCGAPSRISVARWAKLGPRISPLDLLGELVCVFQRLSFGHIASESKPVDHVFPTDCSRSDDQTRPLRWVSSR